MSAGPAPALFFSFLVIFVMATVLAPSLYQETNSTLNNTQITDDMSQNEEKYAEYFPIIFTMLTVVMGMALVYMAVIR